MINRKSCLLALRTSWCRDSTPACCKQPEIQFSIPHQPISGKLGGGRGGATTTTNTRTRNKPNLGTRLRCPDTRVLHGVVHPRGWGPSPNPPTPATPATLATHNRRSSGYDDRDTVLLFVLGTKHQKMILLVRSAHIAVRMLTTKNRNKQPKLT